MSFKSILLSFFTGIAFYSATAYPSENNSYSYLFKETLRVFYNQNYVLDITKNLKPTKQIFDMISETRPFNTKQYLDQVNLLITLKSDRSLHKSVKFLQPIINSMIFVALSPLGIKCLELLYFQMYKIYILYLFKTKLKTLNNEIKYLNTIMNYNNIFNKITPKSFPSIIREFIGHSRPIHDWYNNKIGINNQHIITLKNEIFNIIRSFRPDNPDPNGIVILVAFLTGMKIGSRLLNALFSINYIGKTIPPEFYLSSFQAHAKCG